MLMLLRKRDKDGKLTNETILIADGGEVQRLLTKPIKVLTPLSDQHRASAV